MALYLSKRNKLLAETKAFLYRWTHVPSGKWYVGSRTAVGCHPNDGYICSSKIVKEMILENNTEWSREILVIGESQYIRKLECSILTFLDAKNDSNSFNMNNAGGNIFTTPYDRSGTKNPFYKKSHTKETKQYFRDLYTGTTRSEDIKNKISETLTGKLRSNAVKHSISISVAKLERKICEHCGKTAPPATYGRWHGEKCKMRESNAI